MPPNLQSRPRAFPTFLRAAFWIKLHVAIAPMLLVAFSFCHAAQSVKLAWDASPSSDVTGYNVYYRTASGDWSLPLDVGKVTTGTVSNLNDATAYVFSVTAYNSARIESARSNEVPYTTPAQQEILYSLTVNFGTASPSGPYHYGDQVKVSATPQPGEKFERWDGDWYILASRLSADTTASIVGIDIKDLTITAIYRYTVTVTNGTGDGNYFADDTVQIVADAAPAGQQFAGWTVTGNNVILADAASPKTTFAMPSYAVTATANYSDLPKFTVTVTKGTGDGDYFAGDTVQIVADAAPAGQQFAGWTVTGNVTLANAASPKTTFKMPASAVTVTANYKVSDKIRYYPRSGYRSRMVGGVFEGTNDPASGYKELHKISATPPLAWTTINVNLEGYKYLRYRGPNGSYGNVAEIEFYRDGAKIKGTGYGTLGSWKNRGATYQKALDANTSTYFDGPTADGIYVGIITP